MSPFESQNPNRAGNLIAMAALLLSLAVWAMGAIHVYGTESSVISQRVTATETKQGDQEKRLDRIEDKLDRILDKLKDF